LGIRTFLLTNFFLFKITICFEPNAKYFELTKQNKTTYTQINKRIVAQNGICNNLNI